MSELQSLFSNAGGQSVLLTLIFLARILDVSIGTMRIIFLSKGLKYWAAILGFAEALIWIVAVSKVMQNLGDWQTYVAFALGYSAGNYVGIVIEEHIAIGNLLIRIITKKDATSLAKVLWDAGYGITSVDAQGESGPVNVIFSVVKRKKLKTLLTHIKRHNPQAFYTIEDIRHVNSTYIHPVMKRSLLPQLTINKRV